MRRRSPLAALALLLAACAGCASDPTRLPLGTHRAPRRCSAWATPTATYPLPGGGERLQYSRAPSGFEVNNVDLDASGHVVSIRQELDDGLFDSTHQARRLARAPTCCAPTAGPSRSRA